MKPNFEIMDVTCRDGSYVSNFQMSVSEERNICKGLERIGIPYIEIGHGMGVGAGRRNDIKSLHTDDEYLECAKCNIDKAQYGVFCIPGISSLEDLKKAAEYGCSFIRIGSNVEDIDATEEYIKMAKKLKMKVMSNYMKSYAATINEFKEAVKKSESWGSEVIYIVDSAGGMLPDDIKKYYEAIKSVSNVKVGFHGHNNIGMALANSIVAVDIGINIIDCSLQGLGRSAGNTSLEEFIVCMQKMGYELNIDEVELLLLSKKYVYPLVKNHGINPIDVECGVAGFHSSYLQTIHKIACKYEINPLRLIKEYCKIDRVNLDEQKVEAIAKQMPHDYESNLLIDFEHYFGGEQ